MYVFIFLVFGSPARMGLLDPATSDGRVIFFLPWGKSTVAGTTDNPSELTDSPSPTENEIQFILSEIRHYLSTDVNGESAILFYSLILYEYFLFVF